MGHPDAFLMNDGVQIPALGVGLYKVPSADVPKLVDGALGLGYRLFDTATMYENEAALGRALASSGVPRERFFVTTKVLNSDQGYARTRDACRRSLDLLRLDLLDLYLIHWPAPKQNLYVETWDALQSLQQEGVVRSIGVSNFHPHHLRRLTQPGVATPAINQVECHPWLPQNELRQLHRSMNIVTQAWSPLARGRILRDETLKRISHHHDATPAEVALSWQLHRGVAAISKSLQVSRLAQNMQAACLDLSEPELAEIDGLESGERTGVDPNDRD